MTIFKSVNFHGIFTTWYDFSNNSCNLSKNGFSANTSLTFLGSRQNKAINTKSAQHWCNVQQNNSVNRA